MVKIYSEADMDIIWNAILDGNEDALEELVFRLDHVILAESRIFGRLDEDVAQEIREKLVRAIRRERKNEIDNDNTTPT